MGIPLAALAVQQPPSPLDQATKILALQGLAQNQRYQAQSQPLELQERRQQMESGAVDLQMKQELLRRNQIVQSALAASDFPDEFEASKKSPKTAAPTTTGTPMPQPTPNAPANAATPQPIPNASTTAPISSPAQPNMAAPQPIPNATPAMNAAAQPVPIPNASANAAPGGAMQLHPLAQYLMSKGLPLLGPGGAMEISTALMGASQKMAELAKTQGEYGKTQLEIHGKQLDNFDNKVEPILTETDPVKQQQMIAGLQSEIQQHPELYPIEATQHVDKMGTVQGLQSAANISVIRRNVIEDATKQAEMQTKTLAAGAPTAQQIQNATSTLATYRAIPNDMKAGFATEVRNAPNFATLQDVQKRIDAANESFQRSADAREQANSMKDVAIGQVIAGKLVGEDQKLTDALKQTTGMRGLLDMSKGGNQVATAAAQVRFAEHEIVEGGVKRMNQLELESLATNLGSYGRKFQAWVDKGFSGTMPEATNAEMKTILDAEDKVSQADHDRSVGFVLDRYGAIGGGAARQVQRQGGVNPPTATSNWGTQFGGVPH